MWAEYGNSQICIHTKVDGLDRSINELSLVEVPYHISKTFEGETFANFEVSLNIAAR